jgi:hypothetical protein
MCYCHIMIRFGQGQAPFCCTAGRRKWKLTSEVNVGPSNAAALLHALHLGPTKDVTMCYCHIMVHLADYRQLFAAGARLSSRRE